ncbi:hypothetical protein KY495_12435 [Massilia sp. PAMC28688]|uniref:hypothetical protein n=1 Tax=Massilia sp. PAMC28688 TaxID=2861283 RepID=UPI001C627037|nr:hypothetical protein [Massilia sp. PAMC28688]QYF91617.1 hypothetical protein KY495_12435 [Massilia sp. PAMC28688]
MCPEPHLLQRQRGALSLFWVVVGSVLLAAGGMLALMSMRSERNLFAEAVASVRSAVGGHAVVEAARQNLPGSQLRKCIINGKTVVSNQDCKDENPTSEVIRIQTTRGVVAPKVPVVVEAPRGSDPALDKLIEKQTQ